jgi:hypothetical protein
MLLLLVSLPNYSFSNTSVGLEACARRTKVGFMGSLRRSVSQKFDKLPFEFPAVKWEFEWTGADENEHDAVTFIVNRQCHVGSV